MAAKLRNRHVAIAPPFAPSLGASIAGAPHRAAQAVAEVSAPAAGDIVVRLACAGKDYEVTIHPDLTTHADECADYGLRRDVTSAVMRQRLRTAAFRTLASVVRQSGAEMLGEDRVAPSRRVVK